MDLNVQAFRIVQEAASEVAPDKAKHAASRKGGFKGGTARAKSISPSGRTEIARRASAARWKRPLPA